jgi:hypothetical protein
MPENRLWSKRLLRDLVISPRACAQFARLNPDIRWGDSAVVLRQRIRHGHPRRRRQWRRVELVTGANVPLDYIEVVIRRRQVAVVRKDDLAQNYVDSVRSIGRVVNADPAEQSRVARRSRQAA